MRFLVGLLVGTIQIAHELQRRAEDVADAERDRAHVHVGEVAVEQVRHDLFVAGREHLFRDLAARLELAAGQRHAAAAAGDLELEDVVGTREHDEPALGAGHLERRVHHQREHFVQHAARSQRAEAFEQCRHLPEVADGGGRVLVGGLLVLLILEQEHQLRAAAAAEAHEIAVLQRMLGDGLAIDVGAVTGAAVAQDVLAAVERDLGMVARDVAAHQLQVVAAAPADREHRLVDLDDPPTESVGDFEATVWHREMCGGAGAGAPQMNFS